LTRRFVEALDTINVINIGDPTDLFSVLARPTPTASTCLTTSPRRLASFVVHLAACTVAEVEISVLTDQVQFFDKRSSVVSPGFVANGHCSSHMADFHSFLPRFSVLGRFHCIPKQAC